MNDRIEDNLVLGLARIFTEYGWKGDGAPRTMSEKKLRIRMGLHHGEALDYYTHLKLLVQAREKDNNWGIYDPIYVHGICTLLDAYAQFNDLYSVTEKVPFKLVQQNPRNVFKVIKHGETTLKRLKANGTTVMSYELLEEYGYDKLLKDLREIYPHGTITVHTDTHVPDQIRDWEWDEGVRKMTIYFPIMPIIIISTSEIKR